MEPGELTKGKPTLNTGFTPTKNAKVWADVSENRISGTEHKGDKVHTAIEYA